MNQKLIENLDQILAWVETGMKQGGDFVAREAPILVQEILTYYSIYHLFFVIICVATVGGLSMITRHLNKSTPDWDENGILLIQFFSIVASIGFLIGTIINLFTYLKIIYAPRLYLLETIGRIIGGN